MAHRGEEGIERLSREGASCRIGDGHRKHQRHTASHALHHLLGCIDGRLSIERIKDGFDEQRIHASFDECLHLLVVGFHKFVVSDGTHGRVIHVGAERAGLVGGTY